jgi:hypothetical protein
MGKRDLCLQCLERCVAIYIYIYICDVESVLVTTLFVVSSVGSSSPRVDEPTEDTINKVVTSTDSTSRIYSYAPPQKL